QPTPTTTTAAGAEGRDGGPPEGPRPSAHSRVALVHLVLTERHDARPALVLRARGLQQPAPGGHGRPAAQQCAALTFRHASPHAELDAVVQCVGETFRAYRASGAHRLGPVL